MEMMRECAFCGEIDLYDEEFTCDMCGELNIDKEN